MHIKAKRKNLFILILRTFKSSINNNWSWHIFTNPDHFHNHTFKFYPWYFSKSTCFQFDISIFNFYHEITCNLLWSSILCELRLLTPSMDSSVKTTLFWFLKTPSEGVWCAQNKSYRMEKSLNSIFYWSINISATILSKEIPFCFHSEYVGL